MTQTLNEIMEFDHIIHVDWNGEVTETNLTNKGVSIYAPDVSFVDAPRGEDDINIDDYTGQWEALKGFTGQYSYNGPIMHPSEYVGGGLEKYIRATPGYYVVCIVTDPDESEDDDLVGWVILYKEDDWHNPECVSCVHDCPWNGHTIGAPYCSICDDHSEAVHAGYGDLPCDCGDNHDR